MDSMAEDILLFRKTKELFIVYICDDITVNDFIRARFILEPWLKRNGFETCFEKIYLAESIDFVNKFLNGITMIRSPFLVYSKDGHTLLINY